MLRAQGLGIMLAEGGLACRMRHVRVAVASWVRLGQKLASDRRFTGYLEGPRRDRTDAS